MKRIMISFALILCMVLCGSVNSKACDMTSGCYGDAEIVTCGTQHGQHAYSHYVTEPNGYGYYCHVSSISSVHIITCSACGAYLRSEVRTCKVEHSNCGGTQFGLCQY